MVDEMNKLAPFGHW